MPTWGGWEEYSEQGGNMGAAERIMVFIDGRNFYYGMKAMSFNTQAPLYYDKLSRILAKERKLIRTYFYTAVFTEDKNPVRWREQQAFLTQLQTTPGLVLRTKPLKMSDSKGIHEKGIDILLAVDMLRFARLNTYDTAILASRDGDFEEAIRDVQDMGKQVELAAFPDAALSLRNISNKLIKITPALLSMCLMTNMRSTKAMPEMMAVGR